jgi:predicted alpha/beta-fold hydrolase
MPAYLPPWFLKNGVLMTLYIAQVARRTWASTLAVPPVMYQPQRFEGHGGLPIHGQWANPTRARGTIIATYGITGSLENQWILEIVGRKAYSRGFAVLLFDWRGHGKTGQLSPALSSDGLYEGADYVALALAAKRLGCPPPYWFVGYSLSGQLALWAGRAAADLPTTGDLSRGDIGGVAVVCPSLDSERSLRYLVSSPQGRLLEQAIAKELRQLADRLQQYHPTAIDRAAADRVNSIYSFDQELVIGPLGFATVEDYYRASSPLPFLPQLEVPVLMIYAADDPLFDPTILADLRGIDRANPHFHLTVTDHGGHVGYYSGAAGQQQAQDDDPWWAWNRILDWIETGQDPQVRSAG